MKYDAIVVGAGPAGLTVARIISMNGFRVAVFEKERHLSVKPCGEAVSKQTLEEASVPLSGDFTTNEIKCATIYAPNGKSVSIEEKFREGFMVNKALFLQYLAEKAAEHRKANLKARHPWMRVWLTDPSALWPFSETDV